MAAERNRKHILVLQPPKTEQYTPHKGGGTQKVPPPASRAAHAKTLRASLEIAEKAGLERRRSTAEIEVHGAKPGLYIEFESQPGIELNHSSLGNKKRGIDLVAVSETKIRSGPA